MTRVFCSIITHEVSAILSTTRSHEHFNESNVNTKIRDRTQISLNTSQVYVKGNNWLAKGNTKT